MIAALVVLTGLSLIGFLCAWRLWPADDPDMLEHKHPDGDELDGHLGEEKGRGNAGHHHAFTIDDLHEERPDKW